MIYFDKKVKRFRDKSGRFVAQESVRKSVDTMILESQNQIRSLNQKLFAGNSTIAEWQNGMKDILQSGHTIAFSVARGGHRNLTESDMKELGVLTKAQYGYLNRFAKDIESGKISTVEQANHRGSLYTNKVRVTYAQGEKRIAKQGGKTEVRRILTATESCSDCKSWAGKGFVPIDKMPEIGELLCRQFCKCFLEYR